MGGRGCAQVRHQVPRPVRRRHQLPQRGVPPPLQLRAARPPGEQQGAQLLAALRAIIIIIYCKGSAAYVLVHVSHRGLGPPLPGVSVCAWVSVGGGIESRGGGASGEGWSLETERGGCADCRPPPHPPPTRAALFRQGEVDGPPCPRAPRAGDDEARSARRGWCLPRVRCVVCSSDN